MFPCPGSRFTAPCICLLNGRGQNSSQAYVYETAELQWSYCQLVSNHWRAPQPPVLLSSSNMSKRWCDDTICIFLMLLKTLQTIRGFTSCNSLRSFKAQNGCSKEVSVFTMAKPSGGNTSATVGLHAKLV